MAQAITDVKTFLEDARQAGNKSTQTIEGQYHVRYKETSKRNKSKGR